MIIILRTNATKSQVDHVIKKVEELGLKPVVSEGVERTIIGVIGNESKLRVQPLEAYPGVDRVMAVQKPYKLVSREFNPKDMVIPVGGGVEIGGKKVVVMAGPCTVESEEGLLRIANIVKARGATVLRGGAYKPRTSPYDFQGLGEKGLECLSKVKSETGLLICTEIMDVRDMPLFEKHADIIQIGARNMQNFNLLKEVGKAKGKTVLLKRGMANTIKDFLMAAEYIASQGNTNVVLCERGIRTFEDSVRFTLDVSAIPVVKSLSCLPIIVDPSHAAGKRHIVPGLAKAAVAAGADGIIVEVHDKPEEAVCDGAQALLPDMFEHLMKELKGLAQAVGRDL